jgi:hypothetical protein
MIHFQIDKPRSIFCIGALAVTFASCQSRSSDRVWQNAAPSQQAAECEDRSPTQTFESFLQLILARDITAAYELLALDRPLPLEAQTELRDKLQGMADRAREGWRMFPLAQRIEGDCAIIITHDRPPDPSRATFIDIDPVFLIQRSGNWLVLLEEPKPLRPVSFLALSDEQRARFKQLHAWFEAEQPKVQAQIKRGEIGGL